MYPSPYSDHMFAFRHFREIKVKLNANTPWKCGVNNKKAPPWHLGGFCAARPVIFAIVPAHFPSDRFISDSICSGDEGDPWNIVEHWHSAAHLFPKWIWIIIPLFYRQLFHKRFKCKVKKKIFQAVLLKLSDCAGIFFREHFAGIKTQSTFQGWNGKPCAESGASQF